MTASAAMVQTGSQLGPYRLLRRIGAGGMAEVFLAQRIGAEGFARTVAIKTILAVGAEEEGIGLFLDEARVAGFLEHAAIVQTVDLGFENDTLFIVMEYIAGPALSRVIRDLKKLGRSIPPEVVAYVGARVASALDYAHHRATAPDGRKLELVHRDISPQNIMLTRTGMVKLTDFGVARASVQSHRTRTGQVRGKAAYMAPEQVRAGKLDGRTDIFALCLVLYEALTGVRAYQRKTDIMSMRAILTDEVQPIRELNPDVPEALVDVIMKGLAKKPDQRYATAGELAEALQAANRGHPDAQIEAEISRIIDELFGPEQFAGEGGDGLPVEAWQPTISAQAESGTGPAPHKISGAKLSPKIAAMLQPPEPPTPVSRRSAPQQDALDDLVFEQTPSSLGTPASPSVAYAGMAQSAGVHTPSVPGYARAAETPGSPVSGLSRLGADPLAFGESLAGVPGYRIPGTPTGAPTGARTPTGATSAPSYGSVGQAEAPRGRAVIWASVALGVALVSAVSLLVWSRAASREVVSAPLVPEQRPTIGGPSVVQARSDRSSSNEPAATETPTERPTIERATLPPPSVDAGVADEARKARPATEKRAEPRREEAHGGELAKRTEEAKKPVREGPDAFLARAVAAKRRVTSDPDLQRELTKLINDLSIAPRDITAADQELVRRAESQ
ncbi:protein kinase [Myxococcota bacterium]|nr:protein kinase [Myxococcota bacterium]